MRSRSWCARFWHPERFDADGKDPTGEPIPYEITAKGRAATTTRPGEVT
jgi:hypothetical protein